MKGKDYHYHNGALMVHPHLPSSFILFVLLQYLAGVVDSISTQWENASSLCFIFADVYLFSFML
jgi:hypothetical protein